MANPLRELEDDIAAWVGEQKHSKLKEILLTDAEVTSVLGISERTKWRWRKYADYPRAPTFRVVAENFRRRRVRRALTARQKEAHDWFKKGLSYSQIAKKMKCSRMVVWRHVRRAIAKIQDYA